MNPLRSLDKSRLELGLGLGLGLGFGSESDADLDRSRAVDFLKPDLLRDGKLVESAFSRRPIKVCDLNLTL